MGLITISTILSELGRDYYKNHNRIILSPIIEFFDRSGKLEIKPQFPQQLADRQNRNLMIRLLLPRFQPRLPPFL